MENKCNFCCQRLYLRSYSSWYQIIFKTTPDCWICQPNVLISMFTKKQMKTWSLDLGSTISAIANQHITWNIQFLAYLYFREELERCIAFPFLQLGYIILRVGLIRRAFGKFLAWSFISVTDLQTLSFWYYFKSYLSSILWQNYHEDIIMRTRKILLWIHVLFVYWKTQNFSWKYNILPFEKCAEHKQYFMKLDSFVPYGRPQSGTVVIQLLTELDVSNY